MSDRLRGACGVAALAVVVVGATARSRVSMSITHASTSGAASGIAGLVLLGCGLILIIVLGATAAFERRRGKMRAGRAAQRRPWLQALVMFVIVFGTVLLRRAVVSHHAVEDKGTPRLPAPQAGAPKQSTHSSSSGMSVAALAVAIAILAICTAYVWWRRRRPRGQLGLESDGGNVMQRALSEGAAAMHDIADPRQAVIACYLAMRATLITAGVVVRASDTATQMLVRASAVPFNQRAAKRLTELFLEARYSAHPMSDDVREAAVTALNELRNELRYAPEASASGVSV